MQNISHTSFYFWKLLAVQWAVATVRIRACSPTDSLFCSIPSKLYYGSPWRHLIYILFTSVTSFIASSQAVVVAMMHEPSMLTGVEHRTGLICLWYKFVLSTCFILFCFPMHQTTHRLLRHFKFGYYHSDVVPIVHQSRFWLWLSIDVDNDFGEWYWLHNNDASRNDVDVAKMMRRQMSKMILMTLERTTPTTTKTLAGRWWQQSRIFLELMMITFSMLTVTVTRNNKSDKEIGHDGAVQ